MEGIYYMEGKIKRGDMFYADLPVGVGSEQNGYRPILILSNNIGNKHGNTVIAAIITSKVESKTHLPTHCLIKAQQGLSLDSLVLLEQIQTIDKARLKDFLGMLDRNAMSNVDNALAISVGVSYNNNISDGDYLYNPAQ